MYTKISRVAVVTSVMCAVGLSAAWAASASPAAIISVQPNRALHQRPIVRGVRRDAADNERFSTATNETVELVLADGTSVTLAPKSSMVVDHYSYDPQTRLGTLTLSVVSGSARIIGGALNNTAAIVLNVPGAQAAIDNGIAAIEVDDSGSDLALLLGKTIRVNSTHGDHRVVLRAAGQSLHISPDGSLGTPTTLSGSHAQAWAVTFNPGLISGVVPQFESEATGGPATGVADLTADVAGSAQQAQLVLPEAEPAVSTLSVCNGANCELNGELTLPSAIGTVGELGMPGSSQNNWSSGTVTPSPTVSTNITFSTPGCALGAKLCSMTEVYSGSKNAPTSQSDLTLQSAYLTGDSFIGLAPCNGNTCNPICNGNTCNPICNGNTCLNYGFWWVDDDQNSGFNFNEASVQTLQKLPSTLCGSGSLSPCTEFGNYAALLLSVGLSASENQNNPGEIDLMLSSNYFLAYQISGQVQVNDPTNTFLYATGAASGLTLSADSNGSVDYFSVAPGLEPVSGSRDFLPSDSDFQGDLQQGNQSNEELGLTVAENGMVIINPPAQNETFNNPSIMMDSDFALSSTGASNGCKSEAMQCSTVSLTLGSMQYSGTGAQLDAYTIGSTQVSSEEGNIQFNSPLQSTAVGGGNPDLSSPGRVGYMVMQNCTGSGGCNDLPGGAITSDSNSPQNYALLRVGTGTSSGTYLPSASQPVGFGMGYVAGLVQNTSTNSLAAVTSSNLSLTPDVTTATVSGSANLDVDGNGATLSIGTPGTSLYSAYLGDDPNNNDQTRFGAFAATSGSAPTAALVSAGQLNANVPAASQLLGSPSYLQWGFFFGDFTTTSSSSGSQSWSAQLVPWISGNPMQSGKPLPTGTVTYNGIVAGNALYQNNLYTVTGTYTNSWNFASEKGSGAISVDSALYPIRTSLNSGAVTFNGAILAPTTGNPNSVPSNSTAVGSMSGTFVQGDGTTCTSYCGTMGSLQIVDSTLTAHPAGTYTLVGVFGGSKQ